jgi:hypothetical protein
VRRDADGAERQYRDAFIADPRHAPAHANLGQRPRRAPRGDV